MFKNLTIKARLMLLVAVLSSLMVAMGVGGIFSLRNSNASLKTVYVDRLVPMGELDRVIRLINRNQLTLTTALLQGAPAYAEAIREMRAADQEGRQKWQDYVSTYLTADEQVLATQFEQANEAFNEAVVVPALAALASGDTSRIDTIVRTNMAPNYLPVRKAINALIQLQLDVARREYALGQAHYNTFMALSAAALGLGLAFAAGLAWWLIRSITAPLGQAIAVAESVAAGDLTRTISITSSDETGRLLTAMQAMQTRLTAIVGGVRMATESIGTASAEIASGNIELSRRTENQAASLEETASSMEEITATVKQNADNTRQANQLAASASVHAKKGGAVVQEMVGTMQAIRDSSERIVDIISVIDSIAFQTNILALNAAVEAASAGEQGRGFAVVASEVRNLAQRSASAALEIKQLIGSAVDKVGRGTTLMDQTGATMEQIVLSVTQVADIIGEISAAGREQSEGIDQVNQSIAQIDEVTQQNAALVEEAAAAAQSMREQAQALTRAVAVFRLDGAVRALPVSEPALPGAPLAATGLRLVHSAAG